MVLLNATFPAMAAATGHLTAAPSCCLYVIRIDPSVHFNEPARRVVVNLVSSPAPLLARRQGFRCHVVFAIPARYHYPRTAGGVDCTGGASRQAPLPW